MFGFGTAENFKMAGMDRFAFSRFSEKRSYKGSDVSGYDEYIEGVEPEESASLDTPISENNRGFRLIRKMGWQSGTGLGKHRQGRVEPVPFELKDDHLGVGRWTMELEQAQDATEKRKQLEIEKEVTPDLVEKYKAQVHKEQKIADSTAEMRRMFYCELCDKQYMKYSEWDNHLNSYAHHHRQRLKDLQQYETGRKFGGHRNPEEEQEKMLAAQIIAVERARMSAKRTHGGFAPAFKPIGDPGDQSRTPVPEAGPSLGVKSQGVKRASDSESSLKVAEKKARIAKFGLKFQSAGTLVTVSDGPQKMITRPSIYAPPPLPGESPPRSPDTPPPPSPPKGFRGSEKHPGKETQGVGWAKDPQGSSGKLSFGFSKKQSKPPPPGPPPLMSKSKHRLVLAQAFGEDSDEEEGGGALESLAKLPIRRPPSFKFNFKK